MRLFIFSLNNPGIPRTNFIISVFVGNVSSSICNDVVNFKMILMPKPHSHLTRVLGMHLETKIC